MRRQLGMRAPLLIAAWGTVASTANSAPPSSIAGSPSQKDSPILAIPPLAASAAEWKDRGSPRDLPIRRFVAQRRGSFSGVRINYQVVAEDQVIRNSAGEPLGSIFSFSYLKVAAAPGSEQRPVVFIFNGGPGSASTWLHMGAIGPRVADFQDVTPRQVPPFRIADNPHSLLGVADLVFVDPVGTGFSRIWGHGTAADFYSREADATASVKFINAWLRKHGRWNSPKFLLGESYGTTRVNLVARRLMGGFLDGTLKGVSLNGVILLGGDGGLARPSGSDQFLVTFTTMAATAWHHGLVNWKDVGFDQFIAEADEFARSKLVPGIDAWGHLSEAERASLAARHAGFSGLDPRFIADKRLRIMPSDFRTELLKSRGLEIGHYDSRYTLPANSSLGDPVADDPAMGQYAAPYIGAFNQYIRSELGVDVDDDYIVIDWVNVNLPWDHGKDAATPSTAFTGGAGDPGGDLAAMMRRNPDLRLMSIQGWFDLFGAVGTARYGIAQRGLPADRVTRKEYLSGHMPYVGLAGPVMAEDLKAFIRQAAHPSARGAPK